jgi:hypothetical protein
MLCRLEKGIMARWVMQLVARDYRTGSGVTPVAGFHKMLSDG